MARPRKQDRVKASGGCVEKEGENNFTVRNAVADQGTR